MGYQRIRGELLRLGCRVAASSIARVLRANGLQPAPRRAAASFDDLWRAVGAEVIRTPIQAPNANAVAGRWVGTVRRECLEHLLITGRRHLHRVLGIYARHFNRIAQGASEMTREKEEP